MATGIGSCSYGPARGGRPVWARSVKGVDVGPPVEKRREYLHLGDAAADGEDAGRCSGSGRRHPRETSHARLRSITIAVMSATPPPIPASHATAGRRSAGSRRAAKPSAARPTMVTPHSHHESRSARACRQTRNADTPEMRTATPDAYSRHSEGGVGTCSASYASRRRACHRVLATPRGPLRPPALGAGRRSRVPTRSLHLTPPRRRRSRSALAQVAATFQPRLHPTRTQLNGPSYRLKDRVSLSNGGPPTP